MNGLPPVFFPYAKEAFDLPGDRWIRIGLAIRVFGKLV